MRSSESAEMYLETILVLSKESEHVRAVDIANRMGYSKPTISEWMAKLRKAGMVTVERGHIKLTDAGLDVANRIYERHVLLTKLFESVGVSHGTAVKDACRVEHYISDETFDHLKAHYQQYSAGKNATEEAPEETGE